MVKLPSFVAAAAIIGLMQNAAFAGQTWQGAQIMPMSAQVGIEADNGSPISMYDISWPATVTRTQGRYLWVQDDGGYSRSQVGGWIYSDDVLRIDGARDHFSSELRAHETAWLYWMRGICWENANEPGIAILDYQHALRVEPNTGLDDLQIRLGRLIAREQFLNGRGIFDPARRNTWEGHFKIAESMNPNRPQLFYEWGFALSQACACTQPKTAADNKNAAPAKIPVNSGKPGAEDDSSRGKKPPAPDDQKTVAAPEAVTAPAPIGPTPAGSGAAVSALANYDMAENLSPNWWRLPLARAELMLDQCDQESASGERVVTHFKPSFLAELLDHHKVWQARRASQTFAPIDATQPGAAANNVSQASPANLPPPAVDVLATAVDDFDRAISLNPNALEAYRDRAEALRLANRLDEAEQSAKTACNLCYYRQAYSVRTLAQVYSDTKNYELAAVYALRAAELTSGDERARFGHLWKSYADLSKNQPNTVVVASENVGIHRAAGDNTVELPDEFMSRVGTALPK